MMDFNTDGPVKKETVVEVIVGNVGSVYHGDSLAIGKETYADYVRISKRGIGKAGGEDVSLILNGTVIEEHSGTVGGTE